MSVSPRLLKTRKSSIESSAFASQRNSSVNIWGRFRKRGCFVRAPRTLHNGHYFAQRPENRLTYYGLSDRLWMTTNWEESFLISQTSIFQQNAMCSGQNQPFHVSALCWRITRTLFAYRPVFGWFVLAQNSLSIVRGKWFDTCTVSHYNVLSMFITKYVCNLRATRHTFKKFE